jgi:hypothetical protein
MLSVLVCSKNKHTPFLHRKKHYLLNRENHESTRKIVSQREKDMSHAYSPSIKSSKLRRCCLVGRPTLLKRLPV